MNNTHNIKRSSAPAKLTCVWEQEGFHVKLAEDPKHQRVLVVNVNEQTYQGALMYTVVPVPADATITLVVFSTQYHIAVAMATLQRQQEQQIFTILTLKGLALEGECFEFICAT